MNETKFTWNRMAQTEKYEKRQMNEVNKIKTKTKVY